MPNLHAPNAVVRPVRVGLFGYGYAGRTFHAPLIGVEAGLRLCAVASRDAAKVQADWPGVAVHDDPFALAASPDIDLAVIATPNDTHAPLARAAIDAGKHVVVDKPFTLNLAEARDLVARAERRGVLLSVFHNRRWDSDFLTVSRAIAAGAIGRVAHFESHFDRFRPQVRDRWRERAGPGGGIWFDLGPHLADQALRLFGLPDAVQASLAVQRDGATADDWAHVVLSYAERRVVLHAGMLVAGGASRFVVHGTGGSLVKTGSDRQEAQLLAGMAPGGEGWGVDPDALRIHGPDGDEHRIAAERGDQCGFYRAVAAALDGSGINPVPPIEALAVVAVVEAATTSAREGRTVGLTLTHGELAAYHATRTGHSPLVNARG